MQAEKLDVVIGRLEKVADRLESISVKGAGQESSSAMLTDFEAIMTKEVAEFVALSKKLNDDLGQAASILSDLFKANYDLLKIVAVSKKPSSDVLIKLTKPLTDKIEESKTFASKHFKSEFKSHFEAISAYAACFTWVAAPAKPHTLVGEIIESGVFYTNRILTTFKEKSPDHKTWVQKLKGCFEKLKEYTQEHHGMGLAWNPSGKDASSAQPCAGSAKPAATTATKPAVASGPPSAALFADLKKGTNITSGLKKVDDSQKTHKNPALRAAEGQASARPKAAVAPVKTATTTSTKPPKLELVSNKWFVENQIDQQLLEIKDGEKTQGIYMFNCKNSNLLVKEKINVISVDKCERCCIQLEGGLISAFDITNCDGITIYATDIVPMVNVNSSKSVQVILNDKSINTQVTTNMTSGVNVCYSTPTTEFIEHPIPEVFVSQIKDGKLETIIYKNI